MKTVRTRVVMPLLLGLALVGGALAQTPTPKATNTPAQAPPKAQFEASSSSKDSPFHKLTCPSCKQILAKNAQFYETRDDAVKAGHRPCKACKP